MPRSCGSSSTARSSAGSGSKRCCASGTRRRITAAIRTPKVDGARAAGTTKGSAMREEIRARIRGWATALHAEVDACQRIWISVHESPDGDSIGSALALYGVLRGLGKDVVAIRQPPFPSLYE